MRTGLRSTFMTIGIAFGLACGGSGSNTPPAPSVTVTFQPHAQTTDTDPVQLRASVTGTTQTGISWSVLEPEGGQVVPSPTDPSLATYQPPDQKEGTFHIRATSQADPARYAETEMRVVHPVQISVSYHGPVTFGRVTTFTATVTRTADTRVTWSSFGPVADVVDEHGVFTAPSVPGSYLVKATSQADPTKFATALIVVYDPASVVVLTPSSATIAAGSTVDMGVAVSPSNPALYLTYWMEENVPNVISFNPPSSLTFQAPTTPGVYHLHVRYFDDPHVESVATITVH